MRNTLISLLAFVVGIIILIPVLITMLVAVLLIVITDKLFTREIKEIKHIINGRPSDIRNKQRQSNLAEQLQITYSFLGVN